MVNNIARLLRRDTQIQKIFMILFVVICLLSFLKRVNQTQAGVIKHLQSQKVLILQIPELEKQQTVAPIKGDSLSGIILNKEAEPLAVINNALVKVGDSIGPHTKVVSINNKSVIVNDGAKDIVLKLEE